MQHHSTTTLDTTTLDEPVVATLEAFCDVLDAMGTQRLSQPLRNARLALHVALGQKDHTTTSQICTDLAESFADIAAEAKRMDPEDPFGQCGVALTDSGAPERLNMAQRARLSMTSPRQDRTRWLREIDESAGSFRYLRNMGFDVQALVVALDIDDRVAAAFDGSGLRLNRSDLTRVHDSWSEVRRCFAELLREKPDLFEPAWAVHRKTKGSPFRNGPNQVFGELEIEPPQTTLGLGH
jgi:hypothetical protein